MLTTDLEWNIIVWKPNTGYLLILVAKKIFIQKNNNLQFHQLLFRFVFIFFLS